MKAVSLTGHGGPEKLVYREDLPDPELAEGEVLVEVGAAGVNNTDLWTREGAYGSADDPQATGGWRRDKPMEFPRIQGADIAGQIVVTGEGVPESRVGERVLVDPVLYAGEGEQGLADAELIGSERDGGFAEYVAVPAENAHAIESTLTDEELATFPTAYLTAEHMLNRARIESGEVLLVTGASGGVGSALLQLAGVRGARVVALVGSGKEELAYDLGAEVVITRSVSDLAAAVSEAAEAPAVDVVADVVGGDTFPDLLNVLRPFGRYVTAGAAAGPGSEDSVPEAPGADRLHVRQPGGVRRSGRICSTGTDKAAPGRCLPALADKGSPGGIHCQGLLRQAGARPALVRALSERFVVSA